MLLAVSGDEPGHVREALGKDAAGIRLLVDPNHRNAQRFKAYDEFEDVPIPATVLIDQEGRTYWSRQSHEPFKNFDFLQKQFRYFNERVQSPEGLLGTGK